MGLTIHYALRSQAESPQQARESLVHLRSRALDLPFARVDEIVDLAGTACDYQQYPQEHPLRWLLIQARQRTHTPRNEGYSYTVAPLHIIAFSTWPGAGCEEANFGLSRYPTSITVDAPGRPGRRQRIANRLAGWQWSSFCKTQYASAADCGGLANFLRCHLSVIKLLDQARVLNILGEVHDESKYWDKRDLRALSEQVGTWNAMIAGVARQLSDWFGKDAVESAVPLADLEQRDADRQA